MFQVNRAVAGLRWCLRLMRAVAIDGPKLTAPALVMLARSLVSSSHPTHWRPV